MRLTYSNFLRFGAMALFAASACTSDSTPEATDSRPNLIERPAPGEVRAGQITKDAERLLGGSAENNVGDWKLMNHEAVFTVADVGPSGVYIMNGGALLDADLWRDGDSWDLVYDYAPMIGSVRAGRVSTHWMAMCTGSSPCSCAIAR